MGNAYKCLGIAIIIAIIVGIVAVYFTGNSNFSGMLIALTFILILFYLLYTRCSRCGNLGTNHVSNTKLLNTNEHERHWSREEAVGASVRRNRYGDVIDETTHYQDVDYVTVTTEKTYEDTIVCRYCGTESKKQYKKESQNTYRE